MNIENINHDKGNWSLTVNGNSIRVENQDSHVKLFVNEKLQDVCGGLTNSRLTGKVDGKEIKVTVFASLLSIHCYIFVDNELVLED